MKNAEFICTKCPMGCNLYLTISDEEIVVQGNTCKVGEKYGISEYRNPVRTLTTSIMCLTSTGNKMISVKTSEEIPKDKLFECLEEIKKVKITCNHISIGDIILKNILNLGVDIVATRSL